VIPSAAREAVWVAVAQAGVLLLLGVGPVSLFVAGVIATYVLAVRWADPLQLPVSDGVVALGWIALLELPLVALADVWTWLGLVGLSALGLVSSRIQWMPRSVDPEFVGVEAHLERERRAGTTRVRGHAERANLPGPVQDPLTGLFGGASAPPPVDPYEGVQSIQVDPEDL
jgi:hypothetical protein